MKKTLLAAIAAVTTFGAGSAFAASYDFQAYIDPKPLEEAYLAFQTDAAGFVGPNLEFTATQYGNAAYVYLDKGNAGMGVCGALAANLNPTNTDNICLDAGDDSIQIAKSETLFVEAIETATRINSVTINANHDGTGKIDIGDQFTFMLGAQMLTVTAAQSYGDDWVIDLGWNLSVGGDKLKMFAGPQTASQYYISAVNAVAVPVPAAGLLLLGGLGGLAALKRRKKA